MDRPCVRVPRSEGEATRQRLLDAGVLDHDHEIVHEEGALFIPVTDPDGVPGDLRIVTADVPPRETQTLPADELGFEPSYERLGEIVLLHEDDMERARTIAAAVMDSDLPAKTVANRASKVKGEERVREWTVLAGDGTETVHREYGYEFAVDIAEVFFSPRLATERHRVLEQIQERERVLDMFAGVGPYAVPAAGRGAEVVAVDLNPAAIDYLRANAERNGVADRVTAIEGDVRTIVDEYADWADRIVMNLPHNAAAFLDTAVALAGDECVFHYYDIQHEDDPFGPGRAALKTAATPAYTVTVETEREVRSYAPHELNVCIDARLRRR